MKKLFKTVVQTPPHLSIRVRSHPFLICGRPPCLIPVPQGRGRWAASCSRVCPGGRGPGGGGGAPGPRGRGIRQWGNPEQRGVFPAF